MAKKKRVKLPSEKEIEQLPRWGRVGFAARCARRGQPFAEEKSLIEMSRGLARAGRSDTRSSER